MVDLPGSEVLPSVEGPEDEPLEAGGGLPPPEEDLELEGEDAPEAVWKRDENGCS